MILIPNKKAELESQSQVTIYGKVLHLVKNRIQIQGASSPKNECECQGPCSFPPELLFFSPGKLFEIMILK
jgi:hypothetical protein